MTDPTKQEYIGFADAYEHFNARLFDGELPKCLITLQRKANSRGYFAGDRFKKRGGEYQICEIALNPAYFHERTDTEILSTLVHEQVHLWQHHFGMVKARGYHNKEWAAKMMRVGLHPSSTAAPGGAMTGPSVSHYIIRNGPFDLACKDLLANGYKLVWESPEDQAAKKKDKSKVKYTCPACKLNAWAKPQAKLECATCHVGMHSDEKGGGF